MGVARKQEYLSDACSLWLEALEALLMIFIVSTHI